MIQSHDEAEPKLSKLDQFKHTCDGKEDSEQNKWQQAVWTLVIISGHILKGASRKDALLLVMWKLPTALSTAAVPLSLQQVWQQRAAAP